LLQSLSGGIITLGGRKERARYGVLTLVVATERLAASARYRAEAAGVRWWDRLSVAYTPTAEVFATPVTAFDDGLRN
jgi:hypothetical protein